MPTYPTTRRFFRDDEFCNENAAIAGVVRALARAQNYRYARDLKTTPSDAKVFAEASWPWNPAFVCLTPSRSLGPGFGSYHSNEANLAEIVVPDPRAPATRVRVDVNVVSGAGTLGGTLVVTNATTGQISTVAISGAVGAGNSWWATTIQAASGDVLRVSAIWTSGIDFTVAGLSAWWDPASLATPGATFNAGWSALSQAFHVAAGTTGGPLSTYALRWLGRMANASVYERPQMIAASWLYNPAAGTGAGYSSFSTVVGRYRIPVGGRCQSLNVKVRYRASGACTVGITTSGGWTTVAAVVPAVGWGSATGGITVPIPWAGGLQDVTLTVLGSPTYCDIEHVIISEDGAGSGSLQLPAGETVPTNFDPNLDERLGSGLAIRADDIARLVANEVWLWSVRRDRILVNDCRFTYDESVPDAFMGAAGVTDASAIHEIRTSRRNPNAAFGELRIRAGYHQAKYAGQPAEGDPPITPTAWQPWKFQVGMTDYADRLGAPAEGLDTQYVEGPRFNWASFKQISYQHARGGAVAGSSFYLFETRLLTAGHASSVYLARKVTRPSWLTIEELPFNSPASTYP